MATWQNIVWPAEHQPNRERLRREIERSRLEAKEIARARRARKRQELFFPWTLALAALAVVFIACILFDLS